MGVAVLNISKIDDIRLLISLANEDMQAFDLRFDQFLWSDRKSRNIIRELLEIAEEKTGFSVENKRLMIEAVPINDGCAILFTLLSDKLKLARKKFRVKNKHEPLIYEFNSAGDLLDAISKLIPLNTNIRLSTVIEFQKKYYLIMYTNGGITSAVSVILSEYGKWKGAGKINESKLMEYGKIVSKEYAIEQIGEYMI